MQVANPGYATWRSGRTGTVWIWTSTVSKRYGKQEGVKRGVVEFLKEVLAKLKSLERIRVVPADSGFFAQELLQYLEGLKLRYVVVARMTKWLKREAARVQEWR